MNEGIGDAIHEEFARSDPRPADDDWRHRRKTAPEPPSRFEAPDGLGRALSAFARGTGDFADYVTRERAREAGCTEVATFDRALLREDGFVAP